MALSALEFGGDVNVNVPIIANTMAITENYKSQTDAHLMPKNRLQTMHEWEVGEKVHI